MNIERDIFPLRRDTSISSPQFALPTIEQTGSTYTSTGFVAATDFTVPAGAAAASVTIHLPVAPILGNNGRTGYFGNSSLVLTGAIATTLSSEVAFIANSANTGGDVTSLTNGQFMVDYETAIIYGKRVDNATTGTATYSYWERTAGGAAGGTVSTDLTQIAGTAIPNGVVIPTTTLTGYINTLPTAVYNAAPTVRTEGKGGPFQADANGNLLVSMGTGLNATDDFVSTIPGAPISGTTGAYTSVFSTALETSHVLKAAAGKVYKGNVRVDSTLATNTYYIQLINAALLPSNGAVTYLWNPIKVAHVNGTSDFIDFDFTTNGLPASTGAVVAISTTEFTLTIGTAVLSVGFLTN